MPLHEYRIIEKMATGSFGVVFKVRRILDDQVLVMKRIPLQDLDPQQRQAAAQESFVMSKLHHPFIVAQRDAFLFNDNDLCLVMDYYGGGDLDALLARQRDKDTYFPLRQAMLWFVQMVLAVHYLHTERVMHRDIKSHNVFLDEVNNTVAVGDFGVAEKLDSEGGNQPDSVSIASGIFARRRSSSLTAYSPLMTKKLAAAGAGTLTATAAAAAGGGGGGGGGGVMGIHGEESTTRPLMGDTFQSLPGSGGTGAGVPRGGPSSEAMKGTPLYMAPEALQGETNLKSDVWSLGCILYELLCLRHPYEARDIGALVMRVSRGEREPIPPHYPACISELLDRMFALDPKARPTCAEVLAMPCVSAYLELFFSIRVPCDVPDSPAEVAFQRQVAQLRVIIAEAQRSEMNQQGTGATTSRPASSLLLGGVSGGEVGVPAYMRVEAQIGIPRHLPSVDRELLENKAKEAAVAALYSMGMSPRSSASGSSLGIAASAGTFFLAGSPLRMPSGTGGFRENSSVSGGGGGGGSPSSFSSATAMVARVDESRATPPFTLQPTASMRPFMVYDEDPRATPDAIAMRSPPPAAVNAGAAAARKPPISSPAFPPRGRTVSTDTLLICSPSRPPASAAPSNSPTTPLQGVVLDLQQPLHDPISPLQPQRNLTESPTGKRRPSRANSSNRGDSGSGGGSESTSVSRRGSSVSHDASYARAQDGGAGSGGRDLEVEARARGADSGDKDQTTTKDGLEVFYAQHPNVRDMRYKTTEELAQEVWALRAHVQRVVRAKEHHRDAHMLESKYGAQLTDSMPYTLSNYAHAVQVVGSCDEAGYANIMKGGHGEGDTRTWAARAPLTNADRHQRRRCSSYSDDLPTPAIADGHLHRPKRLDNFGTQSASPMPSSPQLHRTPSIRTHSSSKEREGGKDSKEEEVRNDTKPKDDRGEGESKGLSSECDDVSHAHSKNVLSSPAALSSWLRPYAARREALAKQVLGCLSQDVFQLVYIYYKTHGLLQRDVRLVMDWIPNRAHWVELPTVEEIVVLDSYIERQQQLQHRV